MRLTSLEREQTEINREVAQAATTMLMPYRDGEVSRSTWLALLFLLFGIIERSSARSARLARRFYDEERARALPGLPRHDIFLQVPSFEKFVEDMDEVFPRMRRSDSTDQDVARAAMRAVRTVENAGRWTMMKAVETPDPAFDSAVEFEESDGLEVSFASEDKQRRLMREELSRVPPGTVRGWARVATGRETCGWCLMLVSRGAVYASPKAAGSRLSTREALKASDSGALDPAEHMHAWHTGCDCKVVPVFKLSDWEGKDRFLAAQELWYAATEGLSGQEAVNAFRRAAEGGEYTKYLSRK